MGPESDSIALPEAFSGDVTRINVQECIDRSRSTIFNLQPYRYRSSPRFVEYFVRYLGTEYTGYIESNCLPAGMWGGRGISSHACLLPKVPTPPILRTLGD